MALERADLNGRRTCEEISLPDSSILLESISYDEPIDVDHPSGVVFPFIHEGRCIGTREHEKARGTLERLLQKLSAKEVVGKGHIEGYMRHQYRSNFKAKTLSSSFITVCYFLSHIESLGKSCVEEITKGDLEAFVEHEQDRGIEISSVRTRLGQLYAFVGFLIEEEVVDPDRFRRKIRVKVAESLPRSMEADEVSRLLLVRGEVQDRAMVLLLLRTGMRIGELLETQVGDVNLQEQKILIYEGEKNSVGRVVYFSEDAREALEAWLQERDPRKSFLFYAQGRSSMSYMSAHRMFERYLKKAGLSYKGYTLHCLRHTYATDLLNAGMRLECLQKLMGHTHIEVTRRYARLTDKSREAEYFRAMSIIEREEREGHDQFDRELPAILEEKELLSSHGEELYEHP